GVDEAAFRAALSRFATGVVIVTTRDRMGQPSAITVNAFSSVSLDPPLVLFCLGKSAFNFDTFAGADAFAVNMLGSDQQTLSNRFARKAEDQFSDLQIGDLTTGSPILTGCLAVLDCETEMRHEAGDHLIIVGRVVAIDTATDDSPLLYFDSRYAELKPRDGG
ncbi:MAG: flavin reductase family protein, partial [Geminicoccaceae bacterium]